MSLMFMLYLLFFQAQGAKSEFSLPAKIVEVHDGDTITVEFKVEAKVRLLDCWAPELKTKEGDAAKDFLSKFLPVGSDVLVKIPFNGKLNESFSFGRVLGNVYKDTDGDGEVENLSNLMVKWGFATEKKPK